VAAVALALLAGCGGGSKDAIGSAAKRVLSAPGERISFSGTIRLPGTLKPLTFSGTGSIDNRSHRARVVLSGALRGEEIVDAARGTVLYLRFPSLKTRKPWLRLDVRGQLGRAGFNVGSLALNVGNPAQYVAALRAAAGARKLDTGLYAATVTIGGRRLPVRVRIGDGYVRQVQFAYSVPAPHSQGRIAYRTTISYHDLGPQASIALPPRADVARIGAGGNLEQ
jgi:hypothetical protein